MSTIPISGVPRGKREHISLISGMNEGLSLGYVKNGVFTGILRPGL